MQSQPIIGEDASAAVRVLQPGCHHCSPHLELALSSAIAFPMAVASRPSLKKCDVSIDCW